MQAAADFIIVGAGSAGCAIAARLTEDPSCRVLLIEAGGRDRNPYIKLPVGYARTMGDPSVDWCYTLGPEPHLNNRKIAYPRGKVIGGSSSINGEIYARGGRADYDGWAAQGCAGWDWESVLPYFRRSEDFVGGGETRGAGGPLTVTYNNNFGSVADLMLEAGRQVGVPTVHDYNSPEAMGFGRGQFNIRNGRRWSCADAYLRPALRRPNLELVMQAEVLRLAIGNGVAAGVEIRRDGISQTLRANREVILCAGAIGSPLLLERSGIGQPRRLAATGVPVVAEAPEVGENLQDHLIFYLRRRLSRGPSLRGETGGLRVVVNALNYALFRKGFLSGPPAHVVGYARAAPGEGPSDVQFFGAPVTYSLTSGKAGKSKVVFDSKSAMGLAFFQSRPVSRGHVHAVSSDSDAQPEIVANFMAAEEDQQTVLAGLRLARQIMHQPAFDKIGLEEMTPGPRKQSDEDLLAFARKAGSPSYHTIGTCRMGADARSVVDTQLRARAIGGLRIADASVMPSMVGANTHAASVMIGERAADLIRGN